MDDASSNGMVDPLSSSPTKTSRKTLEAGEQTGIEDMEPKGDVGEHVQVEAPSGDAVVVAAVADSSIKLEQTKGMAADSSELTRKVALLEQELALKAVANEDLSKRVETLTEEQGKVITEKKTLEDKLQLEQAELREKVSKLDAQLKESEKQLEMKRKELEQLQSNGNSQDLIHENASLKQQVKTLKQVLEISGTDETTSKELDAARQRLRELETRCRTLEQQLDEQVAKSKSALSSESLQAELNEKNNELEKQAEKLKTASRRRAQAQSQLAATNASLQEKTTALEELEKTHQETVQNLTEATRKLKELESNLDGYVSKHQALESEFVALQEQHTELKQLYETVNTSYNAEQAKRMELETQFETVKSELDSMNSKMEDQAVEHRIANKRSVNLIKELKAELQRGTEQVSKLEESLKLKDEMIETLQEDLSNARNKENELNRQMVELQQALEQAKQRPKLTAGLSFNRKRANTPPPSSGDEDGVKKALAKRLEGLLNENETLREKIGFLETSIQGYIADIDKLKGSSANANARRNQSRNQNFDVNNVDDDTEVEL